MQRDLDLIRKILLAAEGFEDEEYPKLEGYSEQLIDYHLELLDDAGFVELKRLSTLQETYYSIVRLTWDGHEYLDAIRPDDVWDGVQKKLAKVGSASLPIVKELGEAVLRQQLGL